MAALEEVPFPDTEQEIADLQAIWLDSLVAPVVLLNRDINQERVQYSRDRARLTEQEWQEAESWWHHDLRKVSTSDLAAEVEYQTRCLCELFMERTSGHEIDVTYRDVVTTRAKMVLEEYRRREQLEATRVHWAPQRVTAEFARELKSRIALWEFLEDRCQLGLIRENDHYKACCPFHSEKTPSFKVWDDHYKCFGCGVYGDIYQYLEETHVTTGFIEAVEYVALYARVSLPDPQPYTPPDRHPQPRQRLASTGTGRFAAPARREEIPLLEQYR